MIQNGYFIHFMAPKNLPPLEKGLIPKLRYFSQSVGLWLMILSEVVFMIDRSGSMGGDRITQAKDAMYEILKQMEREAGYTKPSFNWYFIYNMHCIPIENF